MWSPCPVPVERIRPGDRATLVGMLQSADDLSMGSSDFYRRPHPPHEDFLAWDHQKIVGVITGTFDFDYRNNEAFDSLELQAGPHAFVTRLYVDRPARERGIGRDLVRAFAAEADARGCTSIVGNLDASSDPRERIAFFTALGFEITEDQLLGAAPGDVLDAIQQLERQSRPRHP